ncbi:MAG: DUF2334 domain-containing protein [Firmicutes bacterium]|nr:DUF2334 domain-containing protein [Bacillota bacterium]
MKKRIVMGLVILMVMGLLMCGCGPFAGSDPTPPLGESLPKQEAVVMKIEGALSFHSHLYPFGGMVLVDGRLHLPWKAADWWMKELETSIKPGSLDENMLITLDGISYIGINDFCERWDLWPVFSDEGVTLYSHEPEWDIGGTAVGTDTVQNVACLRLEDIMADPTEDSRFTHEKLEKVRALVRWLFDHGQEFSVAWIPVFVDPEEGIVNDLTETFNWYNADFLYTLDEMVRCGGHMGVHGLTHQYGNDVSAAGWEFGEDSPFTLAEAEARMVEAKAIAERLGYEVEFFEFPHYGMTKEQGKLAERHFDVIYQQEPWTKPYGYIETKRIGGRTVKYVPTPADCVQSVYDYEGILQRLSDSYDRGLLVSLFFHPSLDYDKISFDDDGNGTRILKYEEGRGILSGIVERIEEWDMQFGVVW